ncbi:MAG: hypothetical protein IT288_03490 [Bdellovibrionales bacterium]|nr:hypothetical protein [Bdellovibrionales bacterium]
MFPDQRLRKPAKASPTLKTRFKRILVLVTGGVSLHFLNPCPILAVARGVSDVRWLAELTHAEDEPAADKACEDED